MNESPKEKKKNLRIDSAKSKCSERPQVPPPAPGVRHLTIQERNHHIIRERVFKLFLASIKKVTISVPIKELRLKEVAKKAAETRIKNMIAL